MTFKTTKLRDAITFALVAGATAVAGTGVAFAQDADEQQSTQATTLDRIEVTGSRIKRAEIEGALPVTVIDRVQLEASGDVSVADFLRDTTFNSFGSYQSTSAARAAVPRPSAAWPGRFAYPGPDRRPSCPDRADARPGPGPELDPDGGGRAH